MCICVCRWVGGWIPAYVGAVMLFTISHIYVCMRVCLVVSNSCELAVLVYAAMLFCQGLSARQ